MITKLLGVLLLLLGFYSLFMAFEVFEGYSKTIGFLLYFLLLGAGLVLITKPKDDE